MKKIILLLLILVGVKMCLAQTPLQITGNDCNNYPHDLFADLDAGKAAVLFFFMYNCGICPPPANAIQTMMTNITDVYPGMVAGYAFPYDNSTTCTEVIDWCTNYGHLFAPYDSGAHQVAYYGGFGMPSVVLLGGSGPNKRVLFSTLTFTYNDTTVMRDSILSLFATGITDLPGSVSELSVYPNPAEDFLEIAFPGFKAPLNVAMYNVSGEEILKSKIVSSHSSINISSLSSGVYFLRSDERWKLTFVKR